MAKKVTAWKTKGMNRDLSVSAFNPEFAFENVNLRLSTNENNTTLSWVNEKGPAKILDWADVPISLAGIPIGTAVIDHKLVVFTTDPVTESNWKDSIYVLNYIDDAKTKMRQHRIYNGRLNFSVEHPIETLVSFEAEHIQKVYWTDGYNQPRVINVVADSEHISRWATHPNGLDVDTFFDFVPSMKFEETATVEKNVSAAGIFAQGVIQYCYSYYNKYGQQSNVVWVSPLFYLSHNDRGASPDETVTNSFTITINNADINFDYIRLYSIQRTSIDAVPLVKRLIDISINKVQERERHGDIIIIRDVAAPIVYIDNGATGSTIDPRELLFIGGKEITAYTMTDKDNRLFLGNITKSIGRIDDIQQYYDIQRNLPDDDANKVKIVYKYDDPDTPAEDKLKTIDLGHSYGIYGHKNMLNKNHREISTFKGGETYRFGFQLQKKTGEWTDPIFMYDVKNDKYPKTSISDDSIRLSYAESEIPTEISNVYNFDNYKRIRPVIVYPSVGERNVLCQGVLNPTVFNVLDRFDNSPFAQASWFFRPYMANINENPDIEGGIPEGNKDYIYDDSPQTDYFSINGPTLNRYVMVADITDPKILSKGYVTYIETWDTWDPGTTYVPPQPLYKKVYFEGAVKIATGAGIVSKVRYALFSSSPWPIPMYHKDWINIGDYPADTYYRSHEISYASGCYPIGFSNPRGANPTTFKVYSGMGADDNKMYYYKKPQDDSSAPDQYELKFYTDYVYEPAYSQQPATYDVSSYTVTFDTVVGDYRMITDNKTGAYIPYKHYDFLQDAFTTGMTSDEAKNVEIQGSRNVVSNIYSPLSSRTSNTQFIIDQSIVTFNSPDIDIDVDVQSYSTDGLKLRIVGAIPITANISSHKITNGAMLEVNHNVTLSANQFNSFGSGELPLNIKHKNIDIHAGKRLVAEFLWADSLVLDDPNNDKEDKVKTAANVFHFMIYPWHRNGSLNNDKRGEDTAASWLKTKKMANLLYSINSEYFSNTVDDSFIEYDDINLQLTLTENQHLYNVKLPRQKTSSSEINYYPNIDKILYNSNVGGYSIAIQETDLPSEYTQGGYSYNVNSPVSMKYKSTSHAVISLNAVGGEIPILPCGKWGSSSSQKIGKYTPRQEERPYEDATYWGDTNMIFSQEEKDMTSLFGGQKMNFLWLAELYKDVENRFGGTTREALLDNNWLVAGQTLNISDAVDGKIRLQWTDGDTFYQRYDCLKTYAFSPNDMNQIVEILSFMCETHVNIDGRYDRNRGQIDNTDMSPLNFGLFNLVYSQRDNYFVQKKADYDDRDNLVYPNQVYYSMTKTSGADVDEYTHVSLGSTLELEGRKGKINALERFNNQIISFQDTGISQILYNENVQIASTAGAAIEIANSGKVQGARYITDTIGCSNKWSVVNAPGGIYFIEGNEKNIYLFNGQLTNLSLNIGMNTWSKQNIPSPEVLWNPDSFSNFVAYYDKQNKDVLFINNETSLAFSEKVGAFTSFYDYGGTPYLCNLDDTGIWIRKNGDVYKHNAGDYNNFFGVNKPFSMTLIGNPEPTTDKIFTNLEFRASVEDDGEYISNTGKFTPTLPFDSLETWDEYQHGIANLANMSGSSAMKHHLLNNDASLKRKFRMWRCDIPRDNAPVDSITEAPMGIKRFRRRPIDRMRNPWIYLKLQKNAAQQNSVLDKTEIHDMLMTYFS